MRPNAPPGPALVSPPAEGDGTADEGGTGGCAPFFSKRRQYTLRGPMSFRFTAAEIQGTFGGELVGDPAAVIDHFSGIELAGPGAIAFIWNKKYYSALKHTQASLVLAPADIE